MPIHLPPVSRREFLLSSTAGLFAGSLTFANEETNSNRWIFLSDTHIAADPAMEKSGVVMAKNLEMVTQEIVNQTPKAAGLFINGDCALLTGEADDYKTLAKLLEPFSKANLSVHMSLGNHDNRDNFLAGLSNHAPKSKPVDSKMVSVMESEKVNWIILDSLDKVNVTPGNLGTKQLEWLEKILDERKDKPAVIIAHHNPEFLVNKSGNGILDTDQMMKIIVPRKQVKAFIFGHTHHWYHAVKDGIHFVNLPPVAYVFLKTDPNGWVDCELNDKGATFTLHALDKSHKANGEKFALEWR